MAKSFEMLTECREYKLLLTVMRANYMIHNVMTRTHVSQANQAEIDL